MITICGYVRIRARCEVQMSRGKCLTFSVHHRSAHGLMVQRSESPSIIATSIINRASLKHL